jgi:hypothetical protein
VDERSHEGGDHAVGATVSDGLMLTGPHDVGYAGHPGSAEESGGDRVVLAEWALWGKENDEPEYRVLRSSAGTFSREDFHGIISRYASGAKGTLPQYTACWIPEEQGHQGYLAVGIHEHAGKEESRRFGGRARTSGGRLVEYVRLFCVRYDDLAKLRASYAELVAAVREQQLPAGLTGPVQVALPEIESPVLDGSLGALAENVAALLLTTKPVCVLGADGTTGEDRLDFIDRVAALLPYGLRTTLSASTWASATAQNLKLRLFFSSAEIEDRGRTRYVLWGKPAELDLSAPRHMSARLYLSWLRHAGAGTAVDALADQTAPVRFRSADIAAMIAALPSGRPVTDLLEQLADGLRQGDLNVVSPIVTRLRRSLDRGTPDPATRLACQQVIITLGLLGSHQKMAPNTEASVYRVLLRLAVDAPLTYQGYCWIEDAAGGPPRGRLRREIFGTFLFGGSLSWLAWLLTSKAEPEFTDEDLLHRLADRGVQATAPITELVRAVTTVRQDHRPVAYDFAARYLRAYAADPRAELVRRGYLAGLLEDVFPDRKAAQRPRLQETIAFVCHGWPSSDQADQILSQPGVQHTRALLEVLTGPRQADKRHGDKRHGDKRHADNRLPDKQARLWAPWAGLGWAGRGSTGLRSRPRAMFASVGLAVIVVAVVTVMLIALYHHGG